LKCLITRFDMSALPPRTIVLFAALLLATLPAQAEPLTLQEAVRRALEHNERALIATARTDAAQARLGQARTFFFPSVTAQGSYVRRFLDEGTFAPAPDGLGASVSLQMVLFDVRFYPLYRAAVRDAQATLLEADAERLRVAFEAADAFLLTLSAHQVARAAAHRLELSEQTLRDSELRFEAGLVSSNDVTRAQLERATAEQAATRARSSAQTARLQLGFLIASEVPDQLAPPDGVLPAEPFATPPDALVGAALEGRPDLHAQHRRAEQADALALEPLFRWFPFVTLGGQYRVGSEVGFPGRTTNAQAALSLTWQLFDGGRRIYERAERQAQARVQRLGAQAQGRRVALEVRTALVELENAHAAVRQADIAAQVARRNAQEASALYGQGLARALELADASLRLFEAEVTLAREQYARALAALGLRASLGQDPLGREMME
jgi:outer membrane protein